ncbi:MAG: ParB/RepB/Spo0J family partition protein [Bdellovibrionales bacterium]|nr:ParB/RepB/Spo0J family partition protein [Bdellovibrionales bacterium]
MKPKSHYFKSKGSRLGKGLDALLGPMDSKNQILLLDIEKVFPNKNQPRKKFNKETLSDLVKSIKENGILQAILVEEKKGAYQIIAGERRWRACCMAGLKKIPAVLKTDISQKKIALWALVENLQRENLNPMEQALAFKEIMKKNLWNQETLAKYLGISRSSLANSLRLLNLDSEVQDLVSSKKLSFSQARELLQFKSLKQQREMAQACLKKKLTVQKIKTKKSNPSVPFWIRQILIEIQKKKNVSLNFKYSKGKGALSFSFKTEEELKNLLDKLL